MLHEPRRRGSWLIFDVGQKMNCAYAYVLFYDMPGDPAEITPRIGLTPTRVERIGQLRGKMTVKNDSWRMDSPTDRKDYLLENHVRDLLTLLEPKKQEIRRIADECSGRFTLVGYFHHANEGFRLTKEQVSLICEMGLELDCDLYFLGEDEPNKAPEPTSPSVTPRASERTPK